MNNIKTTDIGGFPLVLDDWRFGIGELQDFINVNASLGLEINYVIKGCKLIDNGSSYTLTDGYCYLNGEIRRVRGGTFVKSGGHTFVIQEVNEISSLPASTKVFKDLSVHEVYEVREAAFAVLSSYGIISDKIEIARYVPNLNDFVVMNYGLLGALKKTHTKEWFELTDIGSFATPFTAAYTPSSTRPRARYTSLGLELKGNVNFTLANSTSVEMDIFQFSSNLFFAAPGTSIPTTKTTMQFCWSIGVSFAMPVRATNVKLILPGNTFFVPAGDYTFNLDGIVIDV